MTAAGRADPRLASDYSDRMCQNVSAICLSSALLERPDSASTTAAWQPSSGGESQPSCAYDRRPFSRCKKNNLPTLIRSTKFSFICYVTKQPLSAAPRGNHRKRCQEAEMTTRFVYRSDSEELNLVYFNCLSCLEAKVTCIIDHL